MKGISTLVLVFIIASLATMVLVFLQLVATLGARRAAQLHHSQQAFFAAEGAMYETLRHLKDDPSWPTLPYQDPQPYLIGEAEVKRIITQEDDILKIDITATLRGAKRRLVASFARPKETERLRNDLIFVFDHSTSMEDIDHLGAAETKMEVAKRELKNLICPNPPGCTDSAFDPAYDRLGLIGFGTENGTNELPGTYQVLGFTTDYSEFTNPSTGVDSIQLEGGSCINCAFEEARQMFIDDSRPEAAQVIVLLTDGRPTESFGDSGRPSSQEDCDIFDRNSCVPIAECLDRKQGKYINDIVPPLTGSCICSWNGTIWVADCPACATYGYLNLTCVMERNCQTWQDARSCTLDYVNNNLKPPSAEFIIYTLGLGTEGFGEAIDEDLLRRIASDPDMFYHVSTQGEELKEAFKEIAGQITTGAYQFILKEEIPEPEVETE